MPSTTLSGASVWVPDTMSSATSRARSACSPGVCATDGSDLPSVAEAAGVPVAAVSTDAAVLSASTAAAMVRRKMVTRSESEAVGQEDAEIFSISAVVEMAGVRVR